MKILIINYNSTYKNNNYIIKNINYQHVLMIQEKNLKIYKMIFDIKFKKRIFKYKKQKIPYHKNQMTNFKFHQVHMMNKR